MSRGKPKKEFEEKLLKIRRVTKVTTWWRRLSFRATILIGNKFWKIWIGVWKWSDVSIAIKKAIHEAYKHIKELKITTWGSILYPITVKNKASVIKIIPAAEWTWLKAWSSVRLVLELAWYKNILSKIIGSNNKLNNALTTIKALESFKLKASHTKNIMDTKAAQLESEANEEHSSLDQSRPVRKKTPSRSIKPKSEDSTTKAAA